MFCLKESFHTGDETLHAGPFVLFDDQAEAEVVRRNADRASAGLGVADEVGDVGAMLALDDPHAAVRAFRDDLAGIVEHAADEAGGRPFPDVAADILQAVFVGAESAERSGAGRGGSPVSLALVAGDPAL